MLNRLFLRQLAPILPPDWEGGSTGIIKSNVSYGCSAHNGQNGYISVTVLPSIGISNTLNLTLYAESLSGTVVATHALDLTVTDNHTFYTIPDGTYVLHIEDSVDADTKRNHTVSLACLATEIPPSDGHSTVFPLLQVRYTGPRMAYTTTGDARWEWDVNVVRFNKTTETHFFQFFTKTTLVGSTQTDFIVPPDEPFYGYCTGTTRSDFYYRPTIVTKKVTENATVCGFVAIRGCTDPTATNYNPNATQDDGTCYYRPTVYGCTDPRATNYDPAATDNNGSCVYTAPTVEAIFHVPLVNSLRFVATENVDNVGVMQTLDNVLFCSERHRDIRNVGYFQKVCKADVHTYQWLSNYSTSTLQVLNYRSKEVMNAFPATVMAQNTGDSAFFQGYLKNNTNGQTRIYFNTGDIPAPASVGDVVTIANNSDFAGVYAIVDIKQDIKLQSPYLVINRPYTVGDSVSPADIQFNLAVADYDVMEAIVDWSLLPEGTYQVTITGTDGTHGSITYTSEPVELKTAHPDTLLLTYRNYDNAFDCVYTTGILHQLRVEGELRERLGGGMDEIHREPMNKLTRLRGVAQRRVRWTTWSLPAWLHEKLSVVTRHDYITINGVEYQTEEGYGEPEYNKSTAYANATTVMEQVEWFRAHNDHDLGSINQQPLLIVNGGFLRL